MLPLLPTVPRHASEFRRSARSAGWAVLIGAGAVLGLILCLWATRLQMLAVAVVLASLCPAVPTVLGLAVLRERARARRRSAWPDRPPRSSCLSLG
ncbi:hypothetical protein ABT382_33870 [Streptomyces pharetrae]|uniref:hypothetical protein n=1 Tax=Streptomyces pharetrae TaxID=291370 RepID=UPI003363C01F